MGPRGTVLPQLLFKGGLHMGGMHAWENNVERNWQAFPPIPAISATVHSLLCTCIYLKVINNSDTTLRLITLLE